MKEEIKEVFEVIRTEEKLTITVSSENSNMKMEVTKKNFQFDILMSMTDDELKREICGQH